MLTLTQVMTNEISLNQNEKLEKLHTGQPFIQNEQMFKFGIDAVLLANFASKEIRNNNSVLDLCTGNGIIPVLLSSSSRAKKITGIELQIEVAKLAEKNAILTNNYNENKSSALIEILQGNLKNISNIFPPQNFDAVTVNPPYMKLSKGKIAKNQALSIARSEVECTLEDVIKAASYNLKSNGNFFMIHRPERLQEIMTLMEKYNLGAKNIRFVFPFENEISTMILVHGKKDFVPELKIQSPLIISNKDGTYTEEMNLIYGNTSKGANLPYSN